MGALNAPLLYPVLSGVYTPNFTQVPLQIYPVHILDSNYPHSSMRSHGQQTPVQIVKTFNV